MINIKKHNHSGKTIVIDEHRSARGETNKTMRLKKTVQFIELGPESLFDPINRFLKLINEDEQTQVIVSCKIPQ